MLLTRFLRCGSCAREVRVFDAQLELTGLPKARLPEDGTQGRSDGSFVCPFCGAEQTPARD